MLKSWRDVCSLACAVRPTCGIPVGSTTTGETGGFRGGASRGVKGVTGGSATQDAEFLAVQEQERVMSEQTRNVSIEPEHRKFLAELSWRDIDEPGAYVERGSGDLYRIPKEALIPGASPVIREGKLRGFSLVRLSKDPFITTLEARMLACEHNVEPNF